MNLISCIGMINHGIPKYTQQQQNIFFCKLLMCQICQTEKIAQMRRVFFEELVFGNKKAI